MHITAQAPPPPVSEMTYTVSIGTLNPTIPYHTICCRFSLLRGSVWRVSRRRRHSVASVEVHVRPSQETGSDRSVVESQVLRPVRRRTRLMYVETQ